MSGYRRFVAYVYEYRKGKKESNCGFIKVEVKEKRCVMEVHLRCPGLTPKAECRIYGFIRNAGLMDSYLLGICKTGEGSAECVLETDAMDMGGSGISLGRMGGIILKTESGAFFGTEWDDQPIRPENFREVRQKAEEPVRESVPQTRSSAEETESIPEMDAGPVEEDKAAKKELPEVPEQEEETKQEKPDTESDIADAEVVEEQEVPGELKTESEVTSQSVRGQELPEPPLEPEERNERRERVSMPEERNERRERVSMPEERNERRERVSMPEKRNERRERVSMPEERNERRERVSMPEERNERRERVSMPEERNERQERVSMPEERNERRERVSMPEERNERWERVSMPEERNDRQEQMSPSQSQKISGFKENCNFGSACEAFDDGEIINCRKIQIRDLSRLQHRECALRNNRFLLYGYYNFGHLLLGEKCTGGYILGVPGGYDQQERFMANMFGFPYFKESKLIELPKGRGGYWYRLISAPNFH